MFKHNYTLLIAIVILLVATGTRLFTIQRQSIWFDEGWSAYAAIQPTVQAAIDSDKTNPPLYYVIVNLAARGLGDSEFALRWVSLAFGVLSIALAYQLGKQLFTIRAGLMAALLTTFSPLLWWASQEARMYTLLAVLVLLCALAWHRLMTGGKTEGSETLPYEEKRHLAKKWNLLNTSDGGNYVKNRWRWWLVLWVCELGLLYAHNTGPVVVLWLNGITVLAWVMEFRGGGNTADEAANPLIPTLLPLTQGRRDFRQNTSLNIGLLRTILVWFGGQLAVGLLWMPYFINRFVRLSEANSAVTSTSPLSLDELGRLWQAVWTGTWAMVGHEPLLVLLSGIAFVVAVVMIPWRKVQARWLVLHVVILTAGLWLALSVLGNEVHGRYLVMIAPLLLVAIGAGFSFWASKFRQLFSAASIILFLLTFAATVHFATTNAAYQHDDARGMVRYYADHLSANDSVLMWSYADRYELAYYWDRLGVKAKRITLPEGADLDSVLPLLPTSGDVALNIWYTQRADYRGMMGCLLGDGTVNEPERFETYGMTNLLFHAPTLHPPVLKPFEAALSMAKISAIGEILPAPADHAMCVPIQMMLTKPTQVDLKAAVNISTRLGDVIAHTDAIFADRVQRTSSQLPAGSMITAYALLRLPYGAPEENYSLGVRIYDEQAQPNGYALTTSDGQTRPDLQIAITRTSGADWAVVNRSSDLPVKANLAVAGSDLTLVAHSVQGGTYHNGEMFDFSLLWAGKDPLPDLRLVSDDGKWQVTTQAHHPSKHDPITLDWRRVQIPLDADFGQAKLEFPDGTVVGRIAIESIPAIYNAPQVDTPINIEIPNIGTLVGYSVSGDMGDRSKTFNLSLVWKAKQATTASYTVFAQLIGVDGRVLAQSDSLPALGKRPTTEWRTGEYIVDEHAVLFHADAGSGTANLIVGLYDAATGQRVKINATSDFVTLQTGIGVR